MVSANAQLTNLNSTKPLKNARLVVKKLQFGMESNAKLVLQEVTSLLGANLVLAA